MHLVKLRISRSSSVLALAFVVEPEPPHAASARLASAHGTSRTGWVGKDIGLLSPRRWRRSKVDAHINTRAAESSLRGVDENDERAALGSGPRGGHRGIGTGRRLEAARALGRGVGG